MFRNKSLNKSGFTLVELLVVITIISILSLVGFTLYSKSQQLARDAKRKQDLKNIAAALALYQQANNTYLVAISPIKSSDITNWSKVFGGAQYQNYISVLPKDPGKNDYSYTSDGTTYTICIRLEAPTSADIANNPCSAPYNAGLKYNTVDSRSQTP